MTTAIIGEQAADSARRVAITIPPRTVIGLTAAPCAGQMNVNAAPGLAIAPQAAVHAVRDAVHGRTATVCALTASLSARPDGSNGLRTARYDRRAAGCELADVANALRNAVNTLHDAVNAPPDALNARTDSVIAGEDAASSREQTAPTGADTVSALQAEDYPHREDHDDL